MLQLHVKILCVIIQLLPRAVTKTLPISLYDRKIPNPQWLDTVSACRQSKNSG